jgi:hypothetical protein
LQVSAAPGRTLDRSSSQSPQVFPAGSWQVPLHTAKPSLSWSRQALPVWASAGSATRRPIANKKEVRSGTRLRVKRCTPGIVDPRMRRL